MSQDYKDLITLPMLQVADVLIQRKPKTIVLVKIKYLQITFIFSPENRTQQSRTIKISHKRTICEIWREHGKHREGILWQLLFRSLPVGDMLRRCQTSPYNEMKIVTDHYPRGSDVKRRRLKGEMRAGEQESENLIKWWDNIFTRWLIE